MSVVTSKRPTERPDATRRFVNGESRLRSRPRRTGVLTVGALLVVLSAALFAVVVARAGDREPVLVIGASVAKGEVIERSDLTSTSVAGIENAIPAEDAGSVVGYTAVADLVEGQVLNPDLVTREPTPNGEEAVVGLSLVAAQVPASGLVPGDRVTLVAVPGEGGEVPEAPLTLAQAAEVLSVDPATSDGVGRSISVVVSSASGPRIAAYAAAGRIAVIEVAPEGSGSP